MDDFRGEVNRRFDEAATDVNRRFDEVDRRFDEAAAVAERRFERVERRIDDLNRTLQRIGGGMIFALVGLIATQL